MLDGKHVQVHLCRLYRMYEAQRKDGGGDDNGKGKRNGIHILLYESVYMQNVNPAFYPGEGALRCSAIVNFARGEIPRSFLQKPRAIRRAWNFPAEEQEGKGSDWANVEKLEGKCERERARGRENVGEKEEASRWLR